MRQAIGGAWLYSIVIVFMMFMIAYVSASLNYSRAYKVKTQVVNIIEEYQGITNDTTKKVAQIISANGYTTTRYCSDVIESGTKYIGILNTTKVKRTAGVPGASGEKAQHVCITRTSYKAPGSLYTDYYYDVSMFFKFNIPIFGDIFVFTVRGETNSIYYPTDNSNWT
jgi:hypothetical protein